MSDTGYFVYCNGRRSAPRFDAKMTFDISVIPYTGNASWVSRCVAGAHACLMDEQIPPPTQDYDYCTYHAAVTDAAHPQ